MARPEFEVYDFAVDGATSKVTFTPPEGTWMVELIVRGVTSVGSTTVVASVGDITTASYPRAYHTTTADDTDVPTIMGMGTRLGTSEHAGTCYIYGLQLAAPTVFLAKPMDVPSGSKQVNHGMQSAATAHTTVEVRTNDASNMTVGKCWAIYHKRATAVNVSLAMTGNNAEEFIALNGANSLIVVSPDLVISAVQEIRLHVSDDEGVSWDTGASDYHRGSQNRATTDAGGAVAYMFASEYASTTQGFFAVMENLQVASRSCLVLGGTISAPATNPRHSGGFRQNNLLHDGVRLIGNAGALLNSGTVYVYGAA